MPATPEPVAPTGSGTLLAFDYGSRLIGVAVGNRLTASARALDVIANGNWAALDALVAEWQPQHFVVGLPLALDGSEQPMTRAARQFAAALSRRYARAAELIDERHTSQEASRRFADRRAHGAAKRKDAARIDALAAQIILETWLAGNSRSDA